MAACHENGSIAFVAAALTGHDGRHNEFVRAYQRRLPSVVVLPAVNGYNHTETIEALLESGLAFHNLSKLVRKWGKLATFLTKFRLLQHQVQNGHRYQVSLEDDLVLRPHFVDFIHSACQHMETRPVRPDIVQLSMYAEALLTSLDGARTLLTRIRQYGIRKNDDQQLLAAHLMGHKVSRYRSYLRSKLDDTWPIALGRRTNAGAITHTQGMTWTEMALLRLLTGSSAARSLPSFGNPPSAEVVDGCCSCTTSLASCQLQHLESLAAWDSEGERAVPRAVPPPKHRNLNTGRRGRGSRSASA